MKFKEFVAWCNDRACDGRWGMTSAIACIGIHADVRKQPFWKREKYWKEHYEQQVLDEIVDPINDLIAKLGK